MISLLKLFTTENLIRDLQIDESNCQDVIVPLPNVSSEILRKVIAFCEFHKNDLPLPSPRKEEDDYGEKCIDDIIPWDEEFMKVICGQLIVKP